MQNDKKSFNFYKAIANHLLQRFPGWDLDKAPDERPIDKERHDALMEAGRMFAEPLGYRFDSKMLDGLRRHLPGIPFARNERAGKEIDFAEAGEKVSSFEELKAMFKEQADKVETLIRLMEPLIPELTRIADALG